MLQYETDQVSFNLLALCRNPLGSIRRGLAENIKCYDKLRQITHETGLELGAGWAGAEGTPERLEKLLVCGLSDSDIQGAPSNRLEEFLARTADPASWFPRRQNLGRSWSESRSSCGPTMPHSSP